MKNGDFTNAFDCLERMGWLEFALCKLFVLCKPTEKSARNLTRDCEYKVKGLERRIASQKFPLASMFVKEDERCGNVSSPTKNLQLCLAVDKSTSLRTQSKEIASWTQQCFSYLVSGTRLTETRNDERECLYG